MSARIVAVDGGLAPHAADDAVLPTARLVIFKGHPQRYELHVFGAWIRMSTSELASPQRCRALVFGRTGRRLPPRSRLEHEQWLEQLAAAADVVEPEGGSKGGSRSSVRRGAR